MPLLQTTQTKPPPDVIDFGVGQPQASLLPLNLMKQAAAERFERGDPWFLEYGAEQGDGYFRLALANFLTRTYGAPVSYEQLFVSAGASQSLDQLASLYSQPGDTIFIEEPSYMYAFRTFSDHRLNVVSIETDEHGLRMDALEAALQKQRPAFLYTIPTFHNPTSATQPTERREQLVALSQKYDLLVIADEVYHSLHFGPPPPAPMAAYIDRAQIISLGSFSKTLAPGLRVGWVQATPAVVERLGLTGIVDSGGGLNPFTSSFVRIILEEQRLQGYVDQLRATYGARAKALNQALRETLGDWVTFTEPQGGFFLWLRFRNGIDSLKLQAEAKQHKVGFQPGPKTSIRGGLPQYARLSFAYYDIPALQDGVARLKKALMGYSP